MGNIRAVSSWLSFDEAPLAVTMPEIEETTETAAETAELAKVNEELEAKRTGAWKVSTSPATPSLSTAPAPVGKHGARRAVPGVALGPRRAYGAL